MNARRFMSALRSAAIAKPVVVLKAGRRLAGNEAAQTHSGAAVGSDEVFDAAKLDGATGWRRVLRVDLPLLRPQLALIAVLAIIGNVQYFISPLVLTSGGPGFATTVPALLMYYTATRDGEYGYAMAIAVLLMVLVVVLTAFSRLISRGTR